MISVIGGGAAGMMAAIMAARNGHKVQLFEKNDTHVSAYSELVQGTSDATYRQLDLTLQYRYTNRTPKYILIVATASKYGDYFTGGTGSKLWVDDFELIYD